jgi:hypothetical protein
MSGIAIEPRMPEQRNRELRNRQWKSEAVHPGAQIARVPLGNADDQI